MASVRAQTWLPKYKETEFKFEKKKHILLDRRADSRGRQLLKEEKKRNKKQKYILRTQMNLQICDVHNNS